MWGPAHSGRVSEMRITAIDCHVLLDPDLDVEATSSAQDDTVVEIQTDQGLTGLGETAVNPWLARARIDARRPHTMGPRLPDTRLVQAALAVAGSSQRPHAG